MRGALLSWWAALMLPLLAANPGLAGQDATSWPKVPSFAPLSDRLLPTVVNVTTLLRSGAAADPNEIDDDSSASFDAPMTNAPAAPLDNVMRHLFQGNARRIAVGTGVIVDVTGRILTSDHVIRDAKRITVTLSDGTRLPATVIGTDPSTDLAVLQVKAQRALPFAVWADDAETRVGDWVLAIGNPFGLGGTVTGGLVSALDRDMRPGKVNAFIQIDAPINRGNSGGPIFDQSGAIACIGSPGVP
ncbi:MAG TPA: trypsin-like peptidase domain-containing protein [Stellaceae bacterium]|nr:trypsin-like peptidase domain-containing protein [Stellaceae bacterium]